MKPQARPEEAMQPLGALPLPESVPVIRDEKYLRILKWSAPVAVVVALAGAWFVGLYLWSNHGRTQFAQEKVDSAQATFARQVSLTRIFPESWLAEYNAGTALLAGKEYAQGVELLESAMEGVPQAVRLESGHIQPYSYECQVRMNLSAGLELQGDATTVEEEAQALYLRALELVTPCESSPSGGGGSSEDQDQDQDQEQGQGQGPTGNEAGDRLRDKLGIEEEQPDQGNQGQGQQDGDPDGQQDDSPESPPERDETEEERQRREQLEERNQQQAERERERDEQSNRGSGTGGW